MQCSDLSLSKLTSTGQIFRCLLVSELTEMLIIFLCKEYYNGVMRATNKLRSNRKCYLFPKIYMLIISYDQNNAFKYSKQLCDFPSVLLVLADFD